jgi:alpha 1,3-glucosidase
MFGIPERKFKFQLETTDKNGPYRLFNQDLFPHASDSSVNLYASIPYLTGHSKQSDSSIAWMSATDTWISVLNSTSVEDGQVKSEGTYASFVSESGVFEFFVMASVISPLNVQKSLADITGYAKLPPAYSLGYHFSKWDVHNSAKEVISRNN